MSATSGTRFLVFITGASRGFGRCLALEAARKWGPAVDMHLIARNAEALTAVKRDIEASLSDQSKIGVRVWTWPFDLGNLETLEPNFARIFATVDEFSAEQESTAMTMHKYGKVYLFNNAGSVGPIAYAKDLCTDLPALRQSLDLNVTSSILITSLFLRRFCTLPSPSNKVPALFIINISSMAAIQPFHSWGVYCAGKAARDMFLQVVAQEHQGEGSARGEGSMAGGMYVHLKTLNYAPGPLDTDMQIELRESESIHPPTREWSEKAFREGWLVRPEESASKCLRILTKNDFKSGVHIDYYDDM